MSANTPENKVKAKVKKFLKDWGGVYQHWPVLNGMGSPSLDCVGCYRSRYFSVETKAPGKKPTDRQNRTIAEMEGSSAAVFVIDGSTDELKEWLEYVDSTTGPRDPSTA